MIKPKTPPYKQKNIRELSNKELFLLEQNAQKWIKYTLALELPRFTPWAILFHISGVLFNEEVGCDGSPLQ